MMEASFNNLHDYLAQIQDVIFKDVVVEQFGLIRCWTTSAVCVISSRLGLVLETGTPSYPDPDPIDLNVEAKTEVSLWIGTSIQAYDDGIAEHARKACAGQDLHLQSSTDGETTQIDRLLSGGAFYKPISFASKKDNMYTCVHRGVIGSLLRSANVYVLRAAHTVADWPQVPGARIVQAPDGDCCYSIERPGVGAPEKTGVELDDNLTDYTQPLEQDIIDKITGACIDLRSMMLNAEACQTATQSYDGTAPLDPATLVGAGNYPLNLPVLSVNGNPDATNMVRSPSFIATKEFTSGTVGVNCLPANLDAVFMHDADCNFCHKRCTQNCGNTPIH